MGMPARTDEMLRETVRLYHEHNQVAAHAASAMGVPPSTFKSRLDEARLKGFLLSEGAKKIVDQAQLGYGEAKGGWIHSYDEEGKKIGATRWAATEITPEEIRETVQEALEGLDRLPPVPEPERSDKDLQNFIPIADLHFGGEYGRPEYEMECNSTMDALFGRLPVAQKALIVDLGDTTDANDHKGVTPASGNTCDVIRHGLQGVIFTALRFLKRTVYRALEGHVEVEVEVQRGNHSETSYLAVLVGLIEHFADNPRVTVHVPKEGDLFRVIRWGECGILPDHGDRLKWPDLKDIWTASLADDWAACTAYRLIATAHFHHDKQRDLAGVECRHFRTMAAPSQWAKSRFPPMPRSACAITMHKYEGFDGLVQKKLTPIKGSQE